MSTGFEREWLAIRQPLDEVALDRGLIASIRAWAARPGASAARPIRIVDLGSGTGVALRRATRWLAGRSIEAFAVDRDAGLLAAGSAAWGQEFPEVSPLAPPPSLADGAGGEGSSGLAPYQVAVGGRTVMVLPLPADALAPLAALGGPADGSVDLVLGHAVADLFPLDALAGRVAALLRPRGLAHLALTYDGETVFEPTIDPALDERLIAGYHRHMDRRRIANPAYGGSTAGQRLPAYLERAGLEIVRAGPSVWDTRRVEPSAVRALLDRMLGFVVGSLLELGDPPEAEVRRWETGRRQLLDAERLSLRVGHLDFLARGPA